MSYASAAQCYIPVGESNSKVASHSRLQSGLNFTKKQSATSSHELCKRFVQNACKDPRCVLSHDILHKRSLITAKKKLLQECGINGKISGKSICFFYTTGDVCQKMDHCQYLHDEALRCRVELGKKASHRSSVPDPGGKKKSKRAAANRNIRLRDHLYFQYLLTA